MAGVHASRSSVSVTTCRTTQQDSGSPILGYATRAPVTIARMTLTPLDVLANLVADAVSALGNQSRSDSA